MTLATTRALPTHIAALQTRATKTVDTVVSTETAEAVDTSSLNLPRLVLSEAIFAGEPTAADYETFHSLAVAAAREIAGTLSNPSKMPGHGYSIPTVYCGVGTRLRAVADSTCAHCYAHKRGNYRFRNVQAGLQRRYESLTDSRWVAAMARQIVASGDEWFRWHDSGDIQGPWHLGKICQVARMTPAVKHWLPSREYRMVRSYLAAGGTIPANLTVRLSAHMIGGAVPNIAGLPVSTVHNDGQNPAGAHSCPALTQGNVCGDCRACWSPAVQHVSYHVH